jgi:hypothetical protein
MTCAEGQTGDNCHKFNQLMGSSNGNLVEQQIAGWLEVNAPNTTVVPEPQTYLLFGVGLLMLSLSQIRRRHYNLYES